jgi:hypothetical protein
VVIPNCHRETSSVSIRPSSVAVPTAYDRA